MLIHPLKDQKCQKLTFEDIPIGGIYRNLEGAILLKISNNLELTLRVAVNYRKQNELPDDVDIDWEMIAFERYEPDILTPSGVEIVHYYGQLKSFDHITVK